MIVDDLIVEEVPLDEVQTLDDCSANLKLEVSEFE